MELRTEVEIEASPSRVWDILTDFAAYPSWNPFISHIRGQLIPGTTIEATLSFADGGEAYLRPYLEVVEPPRELVWSTGLWLGGLQERQRFVLQPLGGRTRLVNGRITTGWAIRWFTRRLTQTARGCVGMNEALKRVAEATA